jgi:hypothetical protein
LITKGRATKTNLNEPKNEARKLLKIRSCGKNEPKNEPSYVVENKGSKKSSRRKRGTKMGKASASAKLRIRDICSLSGTASIIFLAYALFLPPCSAAQAKAPAQGTQRLATRVPFAGRKSDGQMGPEDAPDGKPRLLPIARGAASRLAFYKAAEGPGVLAPRGWNCFGTYGSAGTDLYISPSPIDSENFFSPTWKGFKGPAIELSSEVGDTSGRFGVARVIARVFPAHRAFVLRVIKEGLEPPSEFPFGPYPEDKLNYKSSEIVEYQTPAGADGLGTSSSLQKNADPISGVAILVGGTADLLQLSVRLPHNMSDLTQDIIHQVERDAAQMDD